MSNSHHSTINQSVGTSSLEVLASNLNRKYLLIQNNGVSSIFYRVGEGNATVNDIEIVPGGAYEPFNVPINEIKLISDSGTNDVVIIEGEY